MWLNLLKISGNLGENVFMPVGVSFDHHNVPFIEMLALLFYVQHILPTVIII